MKRAKKKLFKDQKKIIVFVAMAGFIVFNIFFFFIPLIYGIVGSFFDWNPLLGKMNFIGMQNYEKIMVSPLFKTSLTNTIAFSAFAVFFRVALGIVIAVGIYSVKRKKDLLRSLYFLPVIMPIVAVSLVWKWVYHPRMGLLNMGLMAFGFQGQNWLADQNLALPSVLLMTIWKDVGYAVIIFMAALMNIPKSLFEAASIDGANSIRKFFNIIIPMMKPTIIFVVITSLISYFQTFVQIFIMTKGGPGDATYVLSYLIFHEAFKNYRFGYASALSVVLFTLILIITFIQYKMFKREATNENEK